MWLSGLHIPESYLTALVQATCRKNGWPLDRSTLYTQVTKFRTAEEVTERAGQGQSSKCVPGIVLHQQCTQIKKNVQVFCIVYNNY